MERIYCLRQNYNQLKRKQYEEYLKRRNKYYRYKKKCYEEYLNRQNKYYRYKKKCYEEYLKNQNEYYLYKKKCYEEYLKRQNKYYLYKKKYDEEHHKRNNDIFVDKKKHDKTDTSQSEFFNSFKTVNIEDNNINDDSIKNNNNDSLEINIEENNLEYKKDDSAEYDKLENKNCTSIEDSSNEELLEENDEELLEENDKELLEENDEKLLEDDYNSAEKEDLAKETNISTGGVYVKLPVILAETNITIPVEATITLEQEVMEIKRIKKNVFLNKYRLIPFFLSTAASNSGILFIAGFIRMSIEYETKTCTTAETANACGNLRHCTVQVPFNFTTRITFFRPPIFITNITTSELEFLTDRPQVCDICAEPVLGRDHCDESFIFTQVFNEKPFVELVKATFTEVDIHKNPILSHKTPIEQKFTQITEKIIVNLTLKVLQKQQVRVATI